MIKLKQLLRLIPFTEDYEVLLKESENVYTCAYDTRVFNAEELLKYKNHNVYRIDTYCEAIRIYIEEVK